MPAIEEYLNKAIENIKDKSHKETVKKYISIRKQIDKVNIRTMLNDIHALQTLDEFLDEKPYHKATQDDLLAWETFLEEKYRTKHVRFTRDKKNIEDIRGKKIVPVDRNPPFGQLAAHETLALRNASHEKSSTDIQRCLVPG